MNRLHRNFLDARRFHRKLMRRRATSIARALQRWTMISISVHDSQQWPRPEVAQ